MKNLESRHQPSLPEQEILDNGGSSKINRVVVRVQSEKSGKFKDVPMVVRTPIQGGNRSIETMTEQYAKEANMHDMFKYLKVPHKYLIPTVRFDITNPVEPKLYETDLTENDKNVVFSGTSARKLGFSEEGSLYEVKNRKEILESLADIAEVFTKKGFEIHHYDAIYFIFNKENHTCRVVVGDYKHMVDERSNSRPKDELLADNLSSVRAAAIQVDNVLGFSMDDILEFFEGKGLSKDW